MYIRKLEASDWKSADNLSSDDFRSAEYIENSSSSLKHAHNLEITPKENTDKPPENPVEEHFEPARKPEQRLSQYIHKLELEERMSSDQSLDASENTAKDTLVTEGVLLNKNLPEEVSPKDADKGINEKLLETLTFSEQHASKCLPAPKSEPPTDRTKEGYTQEPSMTLVATEFSQEASQTGTKDQEDTVITENKDQERVEQILAVIDTLPDDEQLTGSESATKEIEFDSKHMVAPGSRKDNIPYFEDQTPSTKKQSSEETAAFKKEPDEALGESFTASKVAFQDISQDEEASKPFHDFGLESENRSPDVKADFRSNIKDDAVEHAQSLDAEHQTEHKVEEIANFFEKITHESQENQENFSFHEYENEKEPKETNVSKENQETMKGIESDTASSITSNVHTTNYLKQKDETPQKEETFPNLIKQAQDAEQSEKESVEITVVSQVMLEESAFTPVSTDIAPMIQDEMQEPDDQNANQITVIRTEDQSESSKPELTGTCYVKSTQLILEESSKEGNALQTESENNKRSKIMSGTNNNKQETLASNNLNDLSSPVIFDEKENTFQATQLFKQSETDNDLMLPSELKNDKVELVVDKTDKETGTSPLSQEQSEIEFPKKQKTTEELDEIPTISKTTMDETRLATMKPSTTVATTTTKVAKKTIVLQKSNEQVIGKSKVNTASPEIRVTSATPTPGEVDEIKEEEHSGVAPLASKEEDSLGDETKLIGDVRKKANDKKPEVKRQETSPQSAAAKPNVALTSDDGEPLVPQKSSTKKCCTIF